ncbi:unnamed protein product [Prorocentrum cordatum]|uniref:Uncharacterized protein n=1 Tax=Prorocentrum cordatum TaxID=2364126 RepID=A0ABN9RVV3_9DINO|nr:unnamed protein product [Polarella glacialis]
MCPRGAPGCGRSSSGHGVKRYAERDGEGGSRRRKEESGKRREREGKRKKKRKRRKGSALKKEGVRGELEGRSESKPRRAGPIAEREHGPDGRTTWATAGTREHGWPNARLVGGFDWPDHSWASSWVHDGGGDQP